MKLDIWIVLSPDDESVNAGECKRGGVEGLLLGNSWRRHERVLSLRTIDTGLYSSSSGLQLRALRIRWSPLIQDRQGTKMSLYRTSLARAMLGRIYQ
jgi:hypothetical protein